MDHLKTALEQEVQIVPMWWHSIPLPHDVTTPGQMNRDNMGPILNAIRSLDLTEKSVLDIGAADGGYSFAAEKHGARQVVALDYYYWQSYSGGDAGLTSATAAPKSVGKLSASGSGTSPDTLPGKRGFEVAHHALGSQVQAITADFMDTDLAALGTFDVVFFLGVLYHIRNPMEALSRLAAVTKEVAIIETESAVFPGYEHQAMCQFFEGNELAGDPTNWWVPNRKALEDMLHANGFSRIDVLTAADTDAAVADWLSCIHDALSHDSGSKMIPPQPRNYRLIVRAWK